MRKTSTYAQNILTREGQTGKHLFDKKFVMSVFSGVAGAVIQREASQHKKGHA